MKKEIYANDFVGKVCNLDVKKYVSDSDFVVDIIERHMEASKVNIKNSAIIISGGYGVGSRENFNLLFELAEVLGAEEELPGQLLMQVLQITTDKLDRQGLRFALNFILHAAYPDRYNIRQVCRNQLW